MRGGARLPLGVLLAALAMSGPAAAADGSVVGIAPAEADRSWVVLGLPAGAATESRAVVINHTDEVQRVRVTTSDAVTTADGVFTLAGEGVAPQGVGAWTRPAVDRLVLGPRERRTLPFVVAVPPGTEPGDYAGGLVVRSDAPAHTIAGDGVAVNVVERVGLRIYQTVPGRRDGTIAVSPPRAVATGGSGLRRALGLPREVRAEVDLRHVGNVRYDGLRGRAELVDGGRVIASAPLELGTLLPGSARRATARLPLPSLPTGDYTVRMRIDSAPAVQATVPVSVGGGRAWAAGGLAAAGLVGASGIGLRLRRRRSGL